MARQVPVGDIPDDVRESLRILVAATVTEAYARIRKQTPVDTDRLRSSWQLELPQKGTRKLEGQITTNVEYAEPVVYGTSLPPSWGGDYKTLQGTKPGYPDLIAKELEGWSRERWNAILRRSK